MTPADNPHRPPPLELTFDPTPEIFASDNQGTFLFPLSADSNGVIESGPYDELRLAVSLWHPSEKKSIDLDRAYVELRAAFGPDPARFIKVAEIEPVVPPYQSGETYDGWIVLPVLGARTRLAIFGGGFEPRTRLQLRAHGFLVP